MTEQGSVPAESPMSPAQLLQAQYDTLASMYADQVEQNRRLVDKLENIEDALYNDLTPVKVEDINMPFSAMVGLMLKLAFASIPAAIVFVVLFMCAWLTLTASGMAWLIGS